MSRLPQRPGASHGIATEVRHVLVVVPRHNPGGELLRTIRRRTAEGPCRFSLVAPTSSPLVAALCTVGDPLSGWIAWTPADAANLDADAERVAWERLSQLVWLFWEMGFSVNAGVCRGSGPALAAAVRASDCDEVLVVGPRSRWAGRRFARRLARSTQVAVDYIDGR